ncbi:MAG: efflux RND transporter permease subunit [Verrucomicrobiota bacterium]
MSLTSIFIERPVATTLATLALTLAGILAYFELPVAPLPQVDFPSISVSASLPGASPETMAATVATPLERTLGRIPGVNEMTSSSSLGNTSISLQFDLSRDINGASNDVQAAINAARSLLPSGMPSMPNYRKRNPADAPIMILTLTSDIVTAGKMYDLASTVLGQKISQIAGIGQVIVGGSSLPAVRVSLDLPAVERTGLSLDEVRSTISSNNISRPKGSIEAGDRRWQVTATDQLSEAKDYLPMIVGYKSGSAVRLQDVGTVTDSTQDLLNYGTSGGVPSVSLILFRQPGANILATTADVHKLMPMLKASLPEAVSLNVAMERTATIKASLADVQHSMLIAIVLVIMVVWLFLRRARAALVPGVAVPVSLIGTFVVMYFCGYSVDNLSLMALTIATGFVVDDAVVVLENITRHMEKGMPAKEAALLGAKEVTGTVFSMSLSLVAVFIPILFMGGLVGRLFREFAVVLSASIGVSLIISLTVTPTMCARLLARDHSREHKPGRVSRAIESVFNSIQQSYVRTLNQALNHRWLTLMVLLATVVITIWQYIIVPKGFFPEQDTGQLRGAIIADQSISFIAMKEKVIQFAEIIRQDPAVDTINASLGGGWGGARNNGSVFISLKPKGQRHTPNPHKPDTSGDHPAPPPAAGSPADPKLHSAAPSGSSPETARQNPSGGGGGQGGGGPPGPDGKPRMGPPAPPGPDDSVTVVLGRLRRSTSHIPGAMMFLQPSQDIRMGGRSSNASYQYTLQSSDLNELRLWEPKIRAAFMGLKSITDVNSDFQEKGGLTRVVVDREMAARLGLSMASIDTAMNNAFGQRQISPIYAELNQYQVVMEAQRDQSMDPDALENIRVKSSDGKLIPLTAFARWESAPAPLSVNHQGQFAAMTFSFNLAPGSAFSDVTKDVNDVIHGLAIPDSVQRNFAGSAGAFTASLDSQPWLILIAIAVIYLTLGILYESFLHPLTILSTLPSAGVGALLALQLCHMDFDIMGFIGVFLLIGIVKKNAIMMIDFALDAERTRGLGPKEAILEACELRLRPILMTTLAALLGALPLAIGFGEGSELRRPLGVAIVGGLVLSQLLTLYTTPVVYLFLDRLRHRFLSKRQHPAPHAALPAAPQLS